MHLRTREDSFHAFARVCVYVKLFYDDPPAPVLGVPTTTAVLVLSAPTWVLLFIAAIKKGQAEAEEQDGY